MDECTSKANDLFYLSLLRWFLCVNASSSSSSSSSWYSSSWSFWLLVRIPAPPCVIGVFADDDIKDTVFSHFATFGETEVFRSESAYVHLRPCSINFRI